MLGVAEKVKVRLNFVLQVRRCGQLRRSLIETPREQWPLVPRTSAALIVADVESLQRGAYPTELVVHHGQQEPSVPALSFLRPPSGSRTLRPRRPTLLPLPLFRPPLQLLVLRLTLNGEDLALGNRIMQDLRWGEAEGHPGRT